ncbi:WD40 repeat-like protein [Cylindrobasidium torrendii FP15055 ss-10]|uniref:WD40 repeat-like protein n=1 Tax=Cylindrobasidium torrendii FP15055 ss-10 TaxID=1314674 RepID=A0A0D7BM56_9AGAR|nr:WD40 repeat-like protein [Cylindrobasidium torrendii FP15055 ss-10]
MLAIAVTDALAVVEPATVKKAPESVPTTVGNISAVASSVWTPNDHALYLCSAEGIRRWTSAADTLADVVTGRGISNVTTQDAETIIYSSAESIHVFDLPSSTVTQTFSAHKSPVTSLSVSNDGSLLSSTSSDAIHVHNIAHGSHTVLRGFPIRGGCLSAFSKHARTRLLVASGSQLAAYDTTRPSSPLRTITVGSPITGDIVAIACSPFSKTLVAAGTTMGYVGLVDLEKEKGLFRTVALNVSLTTLSFSPEGAALYAGTETGKVLIVDLRALDKAPKSITISQSGKRVESISVLPKNKAPGMSTATSKSSTTTENHASSSSKGADSPSPITVRARVTSLSRRETHARKTSLSMSNPKKAMPPVPSKPLSPLSNSTSNVPFSPSRNTPTKRPTASTPLKRGSIGNSTLRASLSRPENIDVLDAAKSPSLTARVRKSSILKPSTPPTERRRTISATPPRVASTSPPKVEEAARPPRLRTMSTMTGRGSKPEPLPMPRRTRAISSVSRVGPPSPQHHLTARVPKSSAPPTVYNRETETPSPMPPMPPIPGNMSAMLSSEPLPSRLSTPSPELDGPIPDIREPVTPLQRRGKSMSVLGLGTPEVERWIAKGDAKAKTVEFVDLGDSEDDEDETKQKDEQEKMPMPIVADPVQTDDDEPLNADLQRARERKEELKREVSMEIQVSPARRPQMTSMPTPVKSPLRHAGQAQEFLKGVIGDAMFEYQRETKAQMMAMHLEMMGLKRGWRKELQDVMEQYVGDLKDLREENKRLREENERLRRGY